MYKEEETRVIDNNDLAMSKIRQVVRKDEKSLKTEEEFVENGFTEGLDMAQTDALFGEMNSAGEDDGEASAILKAAPVYSGPTPEEIAAVARAEAEQLVLTARQEVQAIKDQAYEAGKKAGYEDGYQQGIQEIQNREQAIFEKEKRLELAYWDKLAEMEPLLVDTINDVYEHVFGIRFGNDKKLIVNLISGALRGIEGCKEFMIHISPKDYEAVKEEKENLKGTFLSADAVIEIIEDITLSKNECMIETVSGIFDCSLGIQMEGLRRELKLLSYEKN